MAKNAAEGLFGVQIVVGDERVTIPFWAIQDFEDERQNLIVRPESTKLEFLDTQAEEGNADDS